MARRLYITGRNESGFQPTLKGTGWNNTTQVIYRETGIRDTTHTVHSASETSTSNVFDIAMLVILTRFDFSGTSAVNDTCRINLARYASNTASFRSYRGSLWISTGATNTARHTIFGELVGGVDYATTPEVAFWQTDALANSYAITAGDYLVWEVGARATNTTSASRTANFQYTGLGPDMGTSGAVATNESAWIEFGGTWESFLAPLPRDGTPMLAAA
jgi:hypothetical protein